MIKALYEKVILKNLFYPKIYRSNTTGKNIFLFQIIIWNQVVQTLKEREKSVLNLNESYGTRERANIKKQYCKIKKKSIDAVADKRVILKIELFFLS